MAGRPQVLGAIPLEGRWGRESHCFLFASSPPQVHCISTEFTPRKKGGEKGVPFRLQIDTFKPSDKGLPPEHLHSAGCLIKVFKVRAAPAPALPLRARHPASPAVWTLALLCCGASACGPRSRSLSFSVPRGMGLGVFLRAPSVKRSVQARRGPLRFPCLPPVAQRS